MSVYSLVLDHYRETWPKWPEVETQDGFPGYIPSQNQINELQRRLTDMERMLKKAKIYDEETGQPDCELGDKTRVLQELADIWGVDINFP